MAIPPRVMAAAPGQRSRMVPMVNNNGLSAAEEGRRSGWSDDPLRRQVPHAGINAGSLAKQISPVRQVSTSKDAVFASSSILGWSSGSFRRPAVSSSQVPTILRSHTPDGSPGAFQRNAPPHRTSQTLEYLDRPGVSLSGRLMPNTKNYESTLRGIKGLNVDANDRIHY